MTVTRAEVRQWMQSVGHRIPPRLYPTYIELWNVPRKIADHKRRGIFESTIAQAAADAGVKVRKARSLGTVPRLRQAWPEAANEEGAHMGRPRLELVR